MEKRFEISLLLDFYGELLTDKQRDIMDLYYNDDLSLAEIAENNNTSRQAIHDLLKRGEKFLFEYESKLHLLERQFFVDNVKKDIVENLNLLINGDIDIQKAVDRIIDDLKEIH
ncbi:putative DNA-binding protein [Clostridium tepidiprofundi DSM 19306]|uniref:UPF0122 protein CLTEP_02800 n=1 Tax=Clostridium tepidiprofundi DSM 19306 TaxID=1121338 RepID=A0A151B8B2_9CLOT|nr:putative DNA-binding protein [Clostridium tepidiprofundi]KYH35887.1 putative DNA-binding protein [Clostridium tepidiprofundi DSM 19306]